MRRIWLLFFVTVLAISLFVAQISFSKRSDAFDAIVQIYAYVVDEQEEFFELTGSGTIISDDGYILTNSHVVVDDFTGLPAEFIDICYFKSDFELPSCIETAEIVGYSEFYDLALLKPVKRYNTLLDDYLDIPEDDEKTYPFLTFLTDSEDPEALPEIRDDISIVGYPDATGTYQITATTGTITGYDSDGLDYIDLVTDAIINAGNSGGAALDSEDRFIGVPYANSIEGYGGQYGYIVPVTEVNIWIKSLIEEGLLEKNPITYFVELRGAAGDKSPVEALEERVANLELKLEDSDKRHADLEQKMSWVIGAGVVLFVLLFIEWNSIRSYHSREEEES